MSAMGRRTRQVTAGVTAAAALAVTGAYSVPADGHSGTDSIRPSQRKEQPLGGSFSDDPLRTDPTIEPVIPNIPSQQSLTWAKAHGSLVEDCETLPGGAVIRQVATVIGSTRDEFEFANVRLKDFPDEKRVRLDIALKAKRGETPELSDMTLMNVKIDVGWQYNAVVFEDSKTTYVGPVGGTVEAHSRTWSYAMEGVLASGTALSGGRRNFGPDSFAELGRPCTSDPKPSWKAYEKVIGQLNERINGDFSSSELAPSVGVRIAQALNAEWNSQPDKAVKSLYWAAWRAGAAGDHQLGAQLDALASNVIQGEANVTDVIEVPGVVEYLKLAQDEIGVSPFKIDKEALGKEGFALTN
jgi:hypothetical protein